jgi:SAM-dependent methyltransferase
MHPSSPQSKEMADESMVRNLAAQAEAIWPQEETIFARHPVGDGAVLDVGCGTSEITARLAEAWPRASFVGIDLEEPHLARARLRCAQFRSRVRFETGDAMAMSFGDATFDFVVCRHLLQAVPDAARVLAEIRRVLRPGGRVHLIAEDYGMLVVPPDGARFRRILAAPAAALRRRGRLRSPRRPQGVHAAPRPRHGGDQGRLRRR